MTAAPRSIFKPAATLALAAAAGLQMAACTIDPFFDTTKYEPTFPAKTFVNWETPHVSPLALSSDAARLYAVNTPAARLEVLDVSGDAPLRLASIPVGIDPVSVRERSPGEVWVVNHLSDSVSIVDVAAGAVVATLQTADEPTDVAFAAGRAIVICSQANLAQVFDLADLSRAPLDIPIAGEDPRAAALSPDGRYLYVSIFESGNHTTLVPWESVSDPSGPYGGVNPPPNASGTFVPAMNESLPAAPPVSIIVRKEPSSGAWRDDNGADWRDFITWDLHDHDLAIIDTADLSIRYATGLMTTNMALAARADGRVVVIGTEADNTRRFEPNITGKFIHSVIATVDPSTATPAAEIADLNPHLADAYAARASSVPRELRDRSLADPRAVLFTADSSRGFVAGMGSNNVAMIDADSTRIAQADVPAGPTGLALDESRARLYVLSKFASTVSVLNADTLATVASVALPDPTPDVIRAGRPFLYDARRTSGLGVTACGACHLDGRTDQLAWDLGDPSQPMKGFNVTCNTPVLEVPVGPCEDFHPMKGPMTTQTLQNIVGTEPFHWRGDRENFHAFNPAFVGLLGADAELSDAEMSAFEAFLGATVFPPNPNRNLDNSFKDFVGPGRPKAGEDFYFTRGVDLAIAKCNDCHDARERGAGTNHSVTPRNLLINPHQSIDVPQIRNMYEKTGFSRERQDNSLGFGHNHDGTIDGMVNFFHIPNFTGFGRDGDADQQRDDIIAYVMSFSTDTHPGVGAQLTIGGPAASSTTGGAIISADARARLDLFRRIADTGDVGLIVKGRVEGAPRGYVYVGNGQFESDRAAEGRLSRADLEALAGPNAPLTFTLVPAGTQQRLGIGANDDGVRDGD